MELKKYQKETIKAIKQYGNAFDDWKEEEISDFYSEWSERNYSASWIKGCEELFYSYAINPPIKTWRSK